MKDKKKLPLQEELKRRKTTRDRFGTNKNQLQRKANGSQRSSGIPSRKYRLSVGSKRRHQFSERTSAGCDVF